MTDEIYYPELIDAAMRDVVRKVLRQIEKTGLPGDHHFYITFATTEPGVQLSPALQARYPEEMTVVLQHQFWDFKVEEHQFTVALSFSGVPERVVVPFNSITAFADPSVRFGLQFQPAPEEDESLAEPMFEDVAPPTEENDAGDSAAKIFSLDAFRKK